MSIRNFRVRSALFEPGPEAQLQCQPFHSSVPPSAATAAFTTAARYPLATVFGAAYSTWRLLAAANGTLAARGGVADFEFLGISEARRRRPEGARAVFSLPMGIGAASHHIGFLSAARFRAHALFDLAARFSRPPGAQPPRGESNLPLMAPHFIQRRSQGPRFQHPVRAPNSPVLQPRDAAGRRVLRFGLYYCGTIRSTRTSKSSPLLLIRCTLQCSVRWHDAYQTERGSHNVTANRLMAPIRTGMLVPPITPSFHPVDLTVQG
jgi:hypothetical protein